MIKLFAITLLFCSTTVNSENVIDITYYISDKSSVPFQIPSEGSGIVTDVLKRLEIPNVNIVNKTLPFKRMILDIKNTENPWITYGSVIWPDSRVSNLSKTPLMTVQHVLMTTSEASDDSIADILKGGLVLIRGFNYPGFEDYIAQIHDKIYYVKTHEAAIQMVLKRRVAAFVEMQSRLTYHLNKLEIERESISLHDISDIIPIYDINLRFSNNFPKEHRNSIEIQLYNLKQTGQLDTILSKYK